MHLKLRPNGAIQIYYYYYYYLSFPVSILKCWLLELSCCSIDLAVGAPYEGQGAVYIFHGGPEGLRSEPSQRIYAGQLSSLVQPLQTFGHTLSAGVDMDLNGYPDMVVGAFGADKLLMFRSRPVINVVSRITSNPSKIAREVTASNRCADRRDTSCILLEVCFQFNTKLRDRSVTPPLPLRRPTKNSKVRGYT